MGCFYNFHEGEGGGFIIIEGLENLFGAFLLRFGLRFGHSGFEPLPALRQIFPGHDVEIIIIPEVQDGSLSAAKRTIGRFFPSRIAPSERNMPSDPGRQLSPPHVHTNRQAPDRH